MTGTVTVNWSGTNTDFYVQDGTAGIDCFAYGAPPVTLAAGDSVLVTGSITQFRGLTEIQPDFSLLQVLATGRPAPEPLVLTCADVNATFRPDYTEPNEGRLIRINGVTYDAVTSTITDASGTTQHLHPGQLPAAAERVRRDRHPQAVQARHARARAAVHRRLRDLAAHAGRHHRAPGADPPRPRPTRTTSSPRRCRCTGPRTWPRPASSATGLTAALGDSVVDTTPVTAHDVTVPGLTSATVYYYSVGSEDVNGSQLLDHARVLHRLAGADHAATINAYFNKSVNTSVAWLHPANGNQDLPARLMTRIDNAKRSIDAAIYSMSGTAGTTDRQRPDQRQEPGREGARHLRVRQLGARPPSARSCPPASRSSTTGSTRSTTAPASCTTSSWSWTAAAARRRASGCGPGSWNLTDPGTDDDYQNAIEIQDQALAVVYTHGVPGDVGERHRRRRTRRTRASARASWTTRRTSSPSAGATPSCYFSPSDGANWQIVSLINSAAALGRLPAADASRARTSPPP